MACFKGRLATTTKSKNKIKEQYARGKNKNGYYTVSRPNFWRKKVLPAYCYFNEYFICIKNTIPTIYILHKTKLFDFFVQFF